ncbi:MAG: hypothetical protein AAFY72_15625 [Cyanobacteria bacterium J06649_4]
MVSSFSFDGQARAQGTSAAANEASQTAKTVDIDTLAQLPGTIILPPVGTEATVSQKHEVNPALALNALGDIQSLVTTWRDQLRSVVRSLHSIHAQGPMVDGWLESSSQMPTSTAAEASLLRHGDADALMQYVESLGAQQTTGAEVNRTPEGGPFTGGPSAASSTANALESATQYRLCSLDEHGRMRSQPCPPEQMGVVSIAIARYQKFKQLMGKKRALEAKLQTAVDQLNAVRSSLQQEDLL